MKFAIFLKSSLLFNNFLSSFLFVNKTLRLNNLKTSAAINAKISVFVVCVEATIYLILYSLLDCTFNSIFFKKASTFYQNHPLALHTVEVFCNLILRNHWFSAWKASDGLTGLELTLRHIGVELEKYFNYLTRTGFMIYWSYTFKVLRMPMEV